MTTAVSMADAEDAVAERPEARSSDAEIRERIQDEIQSSVDPGDIAVAVHDGTAILTGTVGNWSELAAATESAWRGGATWVVNDLELEAGPSDRTRAASAATWCRQRGPRRRARFS